MTDVDWAALARLRAAYLESAPGTRLPDYWRTRAELDSYDRVLGERIGWKWDAVLAELDERGWRPAGDRHVLFDFGAGTGVAARRVVSWLGADRVARVIAWERSPLARAFARERLAAEHPALLVETPEDDRIPVGAILLVSHVITELDERALTHLVSRAKHARALLWVEPGEHAASRRLIEIRETLRRALVPVAPCEHGEACGLAAPERARDWCHHFAPPPPEASRSRHWAEVSRRLGVDLRSLPTSFIVAAAREAHEGAPDLAAGATTEARAVAARPHVPSARVIGRARVEKGRARYLACRAEGARDEQVLRRVAPELWAELKDAPFRVTLPPLEAEGE